MSENSTPRLRKFMVLATLGVIAVAAFLFLKIAAPDTDRRNWPAVFGSDGEALYFTGRSLSGSLMRPIGGNHHVMMMGTGACVRCHGTDRKGGRLWPRLWQRIPSLETEALLGDHAHDDHAHASYTADTLATAIVKGTRPDGSSIGGDMPRWIMSDADLDALIGYLLTH